MWIFNFLLQLCIHTFGQCCAVLSDGVLERQFTLQQSPNQMQFMSWFVKLNICSLPTCGLEHRAIEEATVKVFVAYRKQHGKPRKNLDISANLFRSIVLNSSMVLDFSMMSFTSEFPMSPLYELTLQQLQAVQITIARLLYCRAYTILIFIC